MSIEKNKVVLLHYTLTNDAGEVMDSSSGKDPLGFIYGIGMVIPGLEKELLGKEKGATFQATIAPEDAYGLKEEDRIQQVPLSQFEDPENIAVGITIQIENKESGQDILAMVTAIKDEIVTIDMNHPLSDQTLHFDIEVVDVRDATQQEIDHGHVHGVGGVKQ